jgi:hypothetical protein
MSIAWTNWKVGTSRRLRVCMVFVAVISMLWLMVAWAVGFDTWDYWLFGPALMWIPVLLWATIAACRLQQKLISKPLSFSLPGYRESLRWLSFTAAMPAGVAGALILVAVVPYNPLDILHGMLPRELDTSNAADWFSLFLVYNRRFGCPVLIETCLRVAAGFAAGGAIALLASTSRLVFSMWGRRIVGLVSVLLYFVGAPCLFLGFFFPLAVWPVVFLVGACTCVFIWGRLGNMTRVAQGHRTIIAEIAERKRSGSKKRVSAWVERPSLHVMERYGHVPSRRHLWGSLYCAFGPVPSRWKWHMTGLLGIALAVGYYQWVSGALILVAFALVVARIELPATSNLLLPAGRRERCRATVVTTIGASLLLALAAIGLALLSQSIAPHMPRDRQTEYVALDFSTVLLPSLLVPWLIGFRLLGYTTPGVTQASLRAAVGSLLIVVVVLNSPLGQWIGMVRPVLFSGAFLCGWVFFLMVLRHVCDKACLIRQNARAGE